MPVSNQPSFFAAIQRWQQSGLSQKAWCEQNDMANHVFHYWYRRFRNQQAKPVTESENSFIGCPGEMYGEIVVKDFWRRPLVYILDKHIAQEYASIPAPFVKVQTYINGLIFEIGCNFIHGV